ncbi:DUF1624 domain-containing protein [Curvibacter sp. CHRR-16]|uniref:DUF1624 domain-containing protein n=1 Tax=Curvibacter sp. CHRR-16 TaxID=2835872 RepID=UPI001BD95994|nr:heparan-alpha-glucosaminide N-acetyltransferase [Curvibacter sp. CHRR-16]MBT0570618.1 DUF1624 domain-containing protein [Curvibacter sp. CHRR-16]
MHASSLPISPRTAWLDALRGLAMVWMTVFHFSFDLANTGYTQQNFYQDPLWLWQRVCILSLFLLCAGAGQVLAMHSGQGWGAFWRRWGQIVTAAVLVTVGSILMFPHSFIYFGVLHGMAVMLLLVRLWRLQRVPVYAALGLALLLLFAWSQTEHAHTVLAACYPLLDARWLNWLGIISHKPITEDYVPLLPWLGVLLLGMAAMRWWLQLPAQGGSGVVARLTQWQPGSVPAKGLVWLGRHSLSYYLLHQPVMLGGLALLSFL